MIGAGVIAMQMSSVGAVAGESLNGSVHGTAVVATGERAPLKGGKQQEQEQGQGHEPIQSNPFHQTQEMFDI
jgi:hypothetical protein